MELEDILAAGVVSVRHGWDLRQGCRLRLFADACPQLLKLAVPDLNWQTNAAGEDTIDWADGVLLYADLLDLPKVKDPTWGGDKSLFTEVPGPIPLLRAWLLVQPYMKAEDWSPTTPEGFAQRLVTKKALVAADQAVGFSLLGSDFLPLHSAGPTAFSFDAVMELRWTDAERITLQWVRSLTWECRA